MQDISTNKIDWSKFKGKKGATYESNKKSYVNFINMISRIGFALNSDYTRNSIPVEIVKDDIKINATPVAILKKVNSYINLLETVDLVWTSKEKYEKMSDLDINKFLEGVYTHYKGEKHPNSKKVVFIDAATMSKINEFQTAQAAALFYDINFKQISACCRGRKYTSYKLLLGTGVFTVNFTSYHYSLKYKVYINIIPICLPA